METAAFDREELVLVVTEPRAGGLTWLSPAGAFPSKTRHAGFRKYPETVAVAQQKGPKDEEVRTWTIKNA